MAFEHFVIELTQIAIPIVPHAMSCGPPLSS